MIVTFTPVMELAEQRLAVDWYEGDADVLVVLGASMLVEGTGPQATLASDSYLRCVYAAWNIQRFRYKYVVTSGAYGLAEAMAKYLIQNGASAQQVLIENGAKTTTQNAEFVKKILDGQKGLPADPKIVILTSDYHSWRAKRVFERAGLKVRVIPVPDVVKRAGFPMQRWGAFVDLAQELLKDGFYRVRGEI